MACGSDSCLGSLTILLLFTLARSLKTAVYMSPKFELEPGSVAERDFHHIDFPRGHIAIKSFDAEMVDEAGNPVPLHETYLHHWIAMRYYQRKGVEIPNLKKSDIIKVKNSGVCHQYLPQYFGLGSETRKTSTLVPDPYGIEVGNPAEIPHGFEERWMFNVHAIDTRGTEDKLGCIECRCHLYNVTRDEHGQALESDYVGGLDCCYDGTRCRVKAGFPSAPRRLYLKYSVKYIDWDKSILPLKIYILDVTDKRKSSNESRGLAGHDCQIEYDVNSCSAAVDGEDCIDSKKVSISLPSGGDLIYAVAHQHSGGIGSTLFGEDGRVLCSSIPIYGKGTEPGNEAGYIIGMSTCYPEPGSVKISLGESLTLVSNYSSSQRHTGVMGLFYLLLADTSPHASVQKHKKMRLPNYIWATMLFGAMAALAVVIAYQIKCRKGGYVSIAKHPL